MKKSQKQMQQQAGFTLIEIIAVLVLLGIMAAVAVPRYFDLQSDARKQAVQGALAAGASNLNMAFAKAIATGTAVTQLSEVGADNRLTLTGDQVGDFTVNYTEDGNNCTVTVASGPTWFTSDSSLTEGDKTKTFRCPWKTNS